MAQIDQKPATAPSQAGADDVILSGKLACSLKQTVVVPFSGIVTALLVQGGQKVVKGYILATYRLLPESVAGIHSRLFPSEIKDLELTQIKLSAKMDYLEKKRAGLQQLARKKLTSQQSLDLVEGELRLNADEMTRNAEQLDLKRQLYEDDLALLQKQLGSPGRIKNIPSALKLSAPLNGHVIWISPDIRVGAEVKPGDQAFFIGNLDTMIIKTQVHELEVAQIHLGDKAEVTVVSLRDKKFAAQVSRISWSSVTTASDQPAFYDVEFSVPNPDLILKDGQRATVVIPKASRP
jgi:multidrug resistance efflux pump